MPLRLRSMRTTIWCLLHGAQCASSSLTGRPTARAAISSARSGVRIAPPSNGSRNTPAGQPGADDEVARQPDAVDLHAHAPADLDGQHRERDRNAEPPIEHVVEARVAR